MVSSKHFNPGQPDRPPAHTVATPAADSNRALLFERLQCRRKHRPASARLDLSSPSAAPPRRRAPPATTMRTSALLAVLLALALCADAQKKGEWRNLPRTRGFSPFRGARPFDPAVNLRYCKKRTIWIKYSAGVKNYAPIINSALKKVRSTGGGTVRLTGGTFPLASQVIIYSYSCLVGAGRTKTVLRVKGSVKPFKNAGTVRSFWTERITVSDLTIDGNRKAQRRKTKRDVYGRYGFFSELTNYLYLRRVGTINHGGYGFDPHGSKKHWSYYLLLEDCYARNNGLDGFTLDQTFYVGMTGCLSEKNDRHGTNIVTGTRYAVISRNVMRNNGFPSKVGCGIMSQNNQGFGTIGIRLVNNVVINSRKASLCFNGVKSVVVSGNRVSNSNNKAFCYYVDQSRGVAFRSNTCKPSRPGAILRLLRKSTYSGISTKPSKRRSSKKKSSKKKGKKKSKKKRKSKKRKKSKKSKK